MFIIQKRETRRLQISKPQPWGSLSLSLSLSLSGPNPDAPDDVWVHWGLVQTKKLIWWDWVSSSRATKLKEDEDKETGHWVHIDDLHSSISDEDAEEEEEDLDVCKMNRNWRNQAVAVVCEYHEVKCDADLSSYLYKYTYVACFQVTGCRRGSCSCELRRRGQHSYLFLCLLSSINISSETLESFTLSGQDMKRVWCVAASQCIRFCTREQSGQREL